MTEQEILPQEAPPLPPAPEWVRNVVHGIAQVACVVILENAANHKGFAAGQMDGKRRGALIVLNAAKRKFGSRNQRILAEYLSRKERREFFDE